MCSPIDEIYVTKGQYQKKIMAMGRGFSGRVQKRFCHVKVRAIRAPHVAPRPCDVSNCADRAEGGAGEGSPKDAIRGAHHDAHLEAPRERQQLRRSLIKAVNLSENNISMLLDCAID
jgi:hypothetical protein